MNETISIILPIYKVENYLAKCIESLLAQTYKNIEIILVDDGSPDNCGNICDAYAKKDARIKVIHQQNSGVAAARNAGLQEASGEYIGFVDPDDWVEPQMYERLLSGLKTTNTELAICGYNYYDETGAVDSSRLYPEKEDEILSRKELFKRLSDMPPTVRHTTWNKLFIQKLIGNLRFNEDLKSSEDLDFLNQYLRKVNSAVFVHAPLYCNLVRQGSATHGGLSPESLAQSFEIHEDMYEMTVKEFPELKDHALAYLLDVYVLKYNEAKTKANNLPQAEQEQINDLLQGMKNKIKKCAKKAIFDKEIYWKTRLYYLCKLS